MYTISSTESEHCPVEIDCPAPKLEPTLVPRPAAASSTWTFQP
jgi:hypothetical protein